MLARSIMQNALILAAFALLSIGLIAVFHWLTKEKIQAEMEAKLARTLNELVDKKQYDNDVHHDCTLITDAAMSNNPVRVYRMRRGESPVASVFTVIAPDGYNGNIELIVGVYQNGNIAGIRTIQHQETPGLGDKIELSKSDWITQFNGLSLTSTPEDEWKVKKDGGQFDAFTGATITPRAVLSAIARALTFYEQQQDTLFTSPSNCGGVSES